MGQEIREVKQCGVRGIPKGARVGGVGRGGFGRVGVRPGGGGGGAQFTTVRERLQGTNPRGQTEPKRRFSLIFADSRLFLENKAFGKRRFPQKIVAGTTENRRNLQKASDWRLPLKCVPLSAALYRGFAPVGFTHSSIWLGDRDRGGQNVPNARGGGGTRPESCPWKAWTFDPQIEDFL